MYALCATHLRFYVVKKPWHPYPDTNQTLHGKIVDAIAKFPNQEV